MATRTHILITDPNQVLPFTLPQEDPTTTLIIHHIDSEDETTPATAIQVLVKDHGIQNLDIVIANAGICEYFGPISTMPASELTRHSQINTIAFLSLFSAVLPLFKKPPSAASRQNKFVLICSAVGSLTLMRHIPYSTPAYGASKLAGTYLVGKIHLENLCLIAFPIHPGWVQTEMGNKGAEIAGRENGEAEITFEESVAGLMGVIEKATREEMDGKLMNYDGSVLSW